MKERNRRKCRGFSCKMIWIMILLTCICLKVEGESVLASGEEQKQILNYSNGNRYEGEIVNNHPHGFGILYCANGNRYEGDWVDGKRQGKGTFYWADGRKYEGDWLDDIRQGKGTFYWTDGRQYEGDWTAGEITGTGTMYYADGSRYEGQWSKGYKNGKGTFYWADGRKYEGDWADGRKQGKGTFYWTDGRRYEGDWTAGEITGTGTMYYVDGSRYEGEWSKGYKNGKGTYYYFYGDYYKGEWKNGKKNGSGILYKEDGTKIEGIWTDDVYSEKNVPETKNPVNFPVPKLSGVDQDDILRVAKSQLGYQGSPDGYSIYAAWAGQEGKWWCSEFVAWCANKAGIPESVIPVGIGSGQYRRFYSQKGQYYIVRNNQDNSACGCETLASKIISLKEIQPGDIILFETNGDFSGGPDHTALALSVSGDMVQTIDGNSGNKVTIRMRTADQIHGVCRPLYNKAVYELPGNHTTHIWDSGIVTKKSSCTKPGIKTYTCTICGETREEEIPATGKHDWDSGIVTQHPTASENGIKTYTCYNCGTTKTESIPSVGKISLKDAAVSGLKVNYKYNEKKKRLNVKLTLNGKVLKRNVDYKVSCAESTTVGIKTVMIKGIGDYNGTRKVSFNVVPVKAVVKKIKINTKKMMIKIEEQKGAIYQIQYREKGKSQWKSRMTPTTETVLNDRFKGKKEYQVRVRACAMIGGKKINGAWSKMKVCKVK